MDHETLLALTADIVQAHVSNNSIAINDMPTLIKAAYDSLKDLDVPPPEVSAIKEPAVPIEKSVTPDYIVCLEDGKKMKMLKRHLREHYDMTPDQYREKWGLPPDYPMVASNCARARSEFAKRIGLGKGGRRKPALKVA